MQLDDHLCMCFHVTKRKVVNYLRVEKPSNASQLSECFGAGTGCGWCRPFLQKLHDEAEQLGILNRSEAESEQKAAKEFRGESLKEMTATEYAELRRKYVKKGGGTPPPGASV